jgi:hypothetical protein
MGPRIPASRTITARLRGYLPVLVISTLLGAGLGSLVAFSKDRAPAAVATVVEPEPLRPSVAAPVEARGGNRTEAGTPKVGSLRPPVFVRAFQKVPAPLDDGANLVDAYNEQERNPLWASRMEAELRKRFARHPPAAVGLAGLEIAVTECRDGTCRVDFTYPESMLHLPAPAGVPFKHFTPLDLYIWKAGRFCSALTNIPATPGPDGTTTETTVVAFKGTGLDPDSYQAWSDTRSEFPRVPGSAGPQ